MFFCIKKSPVFTNRTPANLITIIYPLKAENFAKRPQMSPKEHECT